MADTDEVAMGLSEISLMASPEGNMAGLRETDIATTGILLPTIPNTLRKASQLAAEVEQGNREYKYKLTNLTKDQLRHRISQLAWRLNESLSDDSDGTGEQTAVYQIGVDDDGTPIGLTKSELEESLRNLSYMAEIVGCSLTVSQVLAGIGKQGSGVGRGHGPDEPDDDDGGPRLTAEVIFKKIERQMIGAMHLQIAVAGDMSAGKSTLIGVLLSGKLDNGKGLARTHVFRHNHEVQSGTTSSVSDHTIFFSIDGKILNHSTEQAPGIRLRSKSDLECADDACRVASFIDLAGHVKYLKSTLQGIIARSPALCLLCVSAANPAAVTTSMMLEHLGMTIALNLKLAIVITKIDAVTNTGGTSSLNSVVNILQRILALQGKQGVIISTLQQIIELVHIDSGSCPPTPPNNNSSQGTSDGPSKPVVTKANITVPIFLLSSVTGEGLDLIQNYIFQVPLLSAYAGSTETPSGDTIIDQQQYHTEVRIVGSFPKALTSFSTLTAAQTDSSVAENGFEDMASDVDITSSTKRRSGSIGHSPSQGLLSNGTGSSSFNANVPFAVVDGLVHSETVFLVVIQRGVLSVGDILYIGPSSSPYSHVMENPDINASNQNSSINQDMTNKSSNVLFERVRITSLRVSDIAVRSVRKGQCATIRVEIVFPLLAHMNQDGKKSETDVDIVNNIQESKDENLAKDDNETCVGSSQTYHPRRSPVGLIMLSAYSRTSGGKTSLNVSEVSQTIGSNSIVAPIVHHADSLNSFRVSANTSASDIFAMNGNDMIGSLSSRPISPLQSLLPMPNAVWEFNARIVIVNHPGKVRISYQSVVHVDNVKQTARIIAITAPVYGANQTRQRTSSSQLSSLVSEKLIESSNDVELGTGDRALCRFRFLFRPEYLHVGSPLFLREGRIRGIGNVVDI